MSGTRTNLGGKSEKAFGGSASATNEEPVATAERPAPKKGSPNPAHARPSPVAPDAAFDAAPPLKPPMASGRDDPKESEHDHAHQRLHGVSAKRVDVPPKR
jgi:hypothetical protein